jgi:hypothetical protein
MLLINTQVGKGVDLNYYLLVFAILLLKTITYANYIMEGNPTLVSQAFQIFTKVK